VLGKFPLPVEVIPMARSLVAREILALTGGQPVWRDGVVTDNGNCDPRHAQPAHRRPGGVESARSTRSRRGQRRPVCLPMESRAKWTPAYAGVTRIVVDQSFLKPRPMVVIPESQSDVRDPVSLRFEGLQSGS
jgi:hypothetical protein